MRMNYDKCSSPGNPIVSKIETPVDQDDDNSVHTTSLSPASDSVSLKENAQHNGNTVTIGEKENHIGSKDKRRNLDSITQKLLNNKIADNASPKLNLSSSPPSHNQLLNGGNDRNKSRKSVTPATLEYVNGTSITVDVDVKPDDNPSQEAVVDKVDTETNEEPRKRTRRSSVENKNKTPVVVETRRHSQTMSRNSSSRSNSKQRDTSTGSGRRSVDGKTVIEKKDSDETVDSCDVLEVESQSTEIDHKEGKLKRKLRTRTETIVNKKSKLDDNVAVASNSNSTPTLSDEKIASSSDVKAVPKVLRGSCESLEDMSPSCNNDNDRLFKSLMKDIMDVSTDTCRMCNITLPNKKLLRIHAATRHIGYFRFRCSVESCGKMYFSHSDATMHARTSHANQNNDVIRIDASTLGMAAALAVQARLRDK